mmetsp:Transcript_29344/g.55679  ORF Transcript_29344/g.55679 Transcript_29344/m.55679 type:complete len:86 (-) Transcript_29344:177-434(-)
MAENEQIEKLQVFRETTPNGLVLMVSIFLEKKKRKSQSKSSSPPRRNRIASQTQKFQPRTPHAQIPQYIPSRHPIPSQNQRLQPG